MGNNNCIVLYTFVSDARARAAGGAKGSKLDGVSIDVRVP